MLEHRLFRITFLPLQIDNQGKMIQGKIFRNLIFFHIWIKKRRAGGSLILGRSIHSIN
jgi:hypothetical protein